MAAFPPPEATAAQVTAWKRDQERAAAAERRLQKIVRSLSREKREMLRRVRDGLPAIVVGLTPAQLRDAEVTRHSLRNMDLLDDVSSLTEFGRVVAGRLP